MNLHGLVSPAVGVVNPPTTVEVRISSGPGPTAGDGSRAPTFESPGALTGSISGDTLDVSAVSQGRLAVGQTVAGTGVTAGTKIIAPLSGSGAEGTYQVFPAQEAASAAMTTVLNAAGQVQPVSWRDIQQMEGLNLQGTRWKIYLNGQVDGLVRVENKGGDLIILPETSRHPGTWLVALVLEQWPDWVVAAITLQDEDQ